MYDSRKIVYVIYEDEADEIILSDESFIRKEFFANERAKKRQIKDITKFYNKVF